MTPIDAYNIGLEEGPSDITRAAACQDPQWAYWYAEKVDKGPHPDTRAAVCKKSPLAYAYARDVDKGPRNDTRAAACKEPEWAYWYAMGVDKYSRDVTRAGVCRDPSYSMWYIENVDKCVIYDTYLALVINSPLAVRVVRRYETYLSTLPTLYDPRFLAVDGYFNGAVTLI